ncbi:Pentatricopeptide repeat-containing protein, mitochondrial [Vitis vinifera]|uniref:Pentatricopeptide repeat-containing protein, mitochondrial n=1 Tax=Vitis vinifera TaxID=29760 RepID=A0A438IIS4_VITVI|nr:Pentatricopeptide repeat-containing protein, mitochondrial [Vitis vinifera]
MGFGENPWNCFPDEDFKFGSNFFHHGWCSCQHCRLRRPCAWAIVFEQLENPGLVSCSAIVSGFVYNELFEEAVVLFNQFRKLGMVPNAATVLTLIRACVALESRRLCESIHGMVVKLSLVLDVLLTTRFLISCAILGDLKRGREIHTQAIVCGFGIRAPAYKLDHCNVFKVCDLDSSRTVFDQNYWEESCFLDSDDFRILVQNSLISAYSKCGDVEPAYNVFGQMGYIRDIVSWNAILNGYGINGHGEIAVALYHEMRKGRENPDAATYLCVLSACSHSGLVDDGLVIFNQMWKRRTIRPSQDHCGCIVDLLARAGCFSDAREFVSRYMEKMGPNAWRALLSGCQLHGNVGLAELAARRVCELDPEEPGQVVLLSNVYASVGRFQDAEALRASMKKKELIKNPG